MTTCLFRPPPHLVPSLFRRYGRGFYRAWQEGSNPHPPHHAYPAPFSPYGRYPPMGPSGGYGFASPTAAFFGSFPPTAPGYPPHHVGRPAHFPPAYGAAGMPYGGQGGAVRGDGRGGLEARMASPEGGGIMGGMLDQGQGNGNRGRIEGFRGEGQRCEFFAGGRRGGGCCVFCFCMSCFI